MIIKKKKYCQILKNLQYKKIFFFNSYSKWNSVHL